jgi:hypothetical protein
MLYNIGYTNAIVIYCHSMVITEVIQLNNTEWQYYHGMAVNYHGKMFYNIGPWQAFEMIQKQ